MKKSINTRVAVVDLGYVGLPLSVELGKRYRTIGFDINQQRIDALKERCDKTLELKPEEMGASRLSYSTDPEDTGCAGIRIVTFGHGIQQKFLRRLRFGGGSQGTKEQRWTTIIKATLVSSKEAVDFVDTADAGEIPADTYRPSSTKDGETVKIIENNRHAPCGSNHQLGLITACPPNVALARTAL